MKKTSLFLLLFCTLPLLSFADLVLMKNGKPECTIILRKNAAPPEKHAANELALFLGKIANGQKPVISDKAVKGTVPVYLELTEDRKVKEEGFKITANNEELRIAGKEPVGVLYGVYKVLKEYGGIRWLFPGKDGEYYKVKPTISVPEVTIIENPSFSHRDISRVCIYWNSPVMDTLDWGMRNNMRFQSRASKISLKNLKAGREARAVKSVIGGHCFSPLLTYNPAVNAKDRKAYVQKMFKEHPEYFPLIRGKRVFTMDGGVNPQPCTTNADVIRIVAENAVKQFRNAQKPCILSFGNNDTTQWCQCANCLAVDPGAETDAGIISTRYWTFANAVLAEIKKQAPDLRFEGWTYQNYSRAPIGVKPDKRVEKIMVSNHRRCWKHPLDDKNCPTNKWYYDYNKEWNDTGVPFYSYDELSYAGYAFLPVARCWVDSLIYYKKHMPNYAGSHTEISCPDGIFPKRFQLYHTTNNWRMMWQVMYMGMAFHWNVNTDYDKLYEEANSLYYGKGWAGGMREFKKLLYKLFMEAPGCWGYGHSVPVGKFLDVPGAKEKLYQYLDSAAKAAAKDPDKRALAHVKQDREFFEKTWVDAYNKYITNHRDIKLYPLMGKIVIDGKLDERDWQNADRNTRFQTPDGEQAKYQTSVKLAYDEKYLYMGIECFDPAPDKAVCNTTKHDGEVWNDNDLELFINDPIMGGAYYQLMINNNGVICDGIAAPRFDKVWDSGTKIKVTKAKDRFIMELAIPAKQLTGSVFTAGSVLKMNIMRHRVSHGEPNEVSTWSLGRPHNVDVFHPIAFAAPRMVTAGNRKEVNTALWNNGNFDKVYKGKRSRIYKHWKLNGTLYPDSWSFSGAKQYGGDMDYLLHPGSKTNYFVRLRSGFIFNRCGIKSDVVRCSMKLRGKGKLHINILRYMPQKKGWKGLGMKDIKSIDVNNTEWKTFTFEYTRPGDKKEIQQFVLWPGKNSEIDVDDIYVAPK
ncbi:MAG: DUF4838 domain-containing protein [Lentisphaeria bacterium]|nr:DUF4838 domain-containing protein [Lentisphaeria bacterium]